MGAVQLSQHDLAPYLEQQPPGARLAIKLLGHTVAGPANAHLGAQRTGGERQRLSAQVSSQSNRPYLAVRKRSAVATDAEGNGRAKQRRQASSRAGGPSDVGHSRVPC